jgi:sec-independent protein translocase protein TatA
VVSRVKRSEKVQKRSGVWRPNQIGKADQKNASSPQNGQRKRQSFNIQFHGSSSPYLRKLWLAATKIKGMERSTSFIFSGTDWSFAPMILTNQSPFEQMNHQALCQDLNEKFIWIFWWSCLIKQDAFFPAGIFVPWNETFYWYRNTRGAREKREETLINFCQNEQELIIIFAIVFLIFGAKRLPEIGTGIGKALKNFKGGMKAAEEEKEDIRREIEENSDQKKGT